MFIYKNPVCVLNFHDQMLHEADTDIRFLNVHRTYAIANNFTNNNIVFFLISNLKIVCYNNYKASIIMPCLRHYLFGDKIIQSCLKIDTIY